MATSTLKLHSNQIIYVFLSVLGILLVYLLAPILTPFLLGALLAYLLDPLVKHLDKKKIPHLLSVIFVFLLLIAGFLVIVLMLFPLIQSQVLLLVDVIPQITDWLQSTLIPWLKQMVDITTLKNTLSESITKAGWLFSTVLTSGYTLVIWIVNLVLTPVVTFYLLRDWDLIRTRIRDAFPQGVRPTVVELAKEFDQVLGAFFRGQLLVMLALGVMYGTGLMLIGLKIGLIIGLIGGLLSIVPYLGSIFVVVVSSITALVQFGTMESLLWVFGVFLIGQGIESYILTPYLVGERIGLHPVMVIFAIMAGGALFGFFGVLVALPVAALLKVLLSYIRKSYRVLQ